MPARKRVMDRYGTRLPSRRQLRVIELVAEGFKNKEIAKELQISEQVVRNYLGKIYDKIGVSNRVDSHYGIGLEGKRGSRSFHSGSRPLWGLPGIGSATPNASWDGLGASTLVGIWFQPEILRGRCGVVSRRVWGDPTNRAHQRNPCNPGHSTRHHIVP